MIQQLTMQQYKCFVNETVCFSNLTVLSGLNSMGKSSLIDALLLLRQSYLREDGRVPFGLHLNGRYVSLGNGLDVLSEHGESDNISFKLVYDKVKYDDTWIANSNQRVLKSKISLAKTYPVNLQKLALFHDNRGKFLHFTYLNAERLGPRTMYPIMDEDSTEQNELGIQGEYTSQFLNVFGGKKLPIQAMVLAEGSSPTLLLQVQEWLNIISPGIQIDTKLDAEVDAVKLRYHYSRPQQTISGDYRPIHVGFGITYVLPVVVALLATVQGGMVLLENPEAHLHPRGQTELGRLMARAAANGVQIVVETHSDHIINGIRLAVKKKEIRQEDVQINFFSPSVTLPGNCIQFIHVNEKGELESWPENFLSEWENNLWKLNFDEEGSL